MISFSENHESALISYEDGQALASLRDPQGEALKWVYSLGILPTKHIVVVGLGAGFHIAALADVDPELRITVVESRESLISVFRSQFSDIENRVEVVIAHSAQELLGSLAFEEIQDNRCFVVSFRECWAAQANLFTEYFAHLTGRTLESVQYHLAEMEINLKALFLDNNKTLSVKDILPIIEASALEEREKQNFRILGELVN